MKYMFQEKSAGEQTDSGSLYKIYFFGTHNFIYCTAAVEDVCVNVAAQNVPERSPCHQICIHLLSKGGMFLFYNFFCLIANRKYYKSWSVCGKVSAFLMDLFFSLPQHG